MDSPILYPDSKESSIGKLKAILKHMCNEGCSHPPKGCEQADTQAQCNELIREYFTEKKTSLVK